MLIAEMSFFSAWLFKKTEDSLNDECMRKCSYLKRG